MTNPEVFPVTPLPDARVLILPGWLNSDAAHWQSRWELLHGDQRVEQDDWQWPKRGDWMARLEEVLLQSDTPAVLVAHSLGCHLVAAWAAHSKHTHRVKAAMLVALPDIERDDMPPQLAPWRPIVRQHLPFASMAVVSSDDPFGTPERAAQMATDWGSELMSVGARGHINGESGLGDWPEGRAMLRALVEAAA
jgi:predicted alpha/beta hydrolase family esterase